MSDEHYSVTFDYLTKGGKPAILRSPPVIITQPQNKGGSASSVIGGAIATAIVSSLLGGLFSAFAKTKALHIPRTTVATPKQAVSIPVKKYDPSHFTQKQIDAIKEHARKQADASNDAMNRGQADSIAQVFKRNEAERKRLIAERDSIAKLHKDAMKQLVSPRRLDQANEHVNKLKMDQVMSASSGIDYKITTVKMPPAYVPLKGETIPLEIAKPPTMQLKQLPQMQQAAQSKTYEPLPLAPGVDNGKSLNVVKKQNGLNEVTE